MNLSLLPAGFDALVRWVWETSGQAGIIVAVVWLAQVLFGRWLPAYGRYALWLLVVLRLLMPTAPASSYSLFNVPTWLTPKPGASAGVETVLPSTAPLSRPAATAWSDSRRDSPSETLIAAEPLDKTQPAVSFTTVLEGLWLLGALAYTALVMRQHPRCSALINAAPAVDAPHLFEALENARAALRLTVPVSVVAVTGVSAPAVFGIRRPCLLVPRLLLDRLTTEELEMVFLHELTHIRRRDVLQNWLLIALQALHWFNPLVWYAFKRLKAERELVCDARLLRGMQAEHRHAYGRTLLKLAEEFLPAKLSPGLVPVLNHHTELKRRITMIARFRPVTPLGAVGAAAVVAALVFVTLTGAADKEIQRPPSEQSTEQVPDAAKARTREVFLQNLETELARHDALVQTQQQKVDEVKIRLRIADFEAGGDGAVLLDPEILRKMEGLSVEANADYNQVNALFKQLSALTRQELVSVLPTAAPDALLNKLLEQEASVQQRLADLTERFADDHPEVKGARRVLSEINKQIEERLAGILQGLRFQSIAAKARLESLEKDMERFKREAIENARERRPYWQAKRQLESLQFVRERLLFKILQEKVDAALPKTSEPTP